MPRTSPYGTWASPVTLDRLVEDVVGLSFPTTSATHVYWVEARPSEGGRQVVVRRPVAGGEREDVFPAGFNARTTVHEYGGLCVVVQEDGAGHDTVYFSNFPDQRIYRVSAGGAPAPITPEPPTPRALRYAAAVLTGDGRHLIAVRERHGDPDVPSTVENDVVVVATDGSSPPRPILSGHDFYSHVVVSPDGRRLCWVSWDDPNMPWDGTELWEGELDVDGASVGAPRLVAGGPSESVTQPKYAPDGSLYFVSDRTGWWNLYAADLDGGAHRAVAPMEADLAGPDWIFGNSSYVLLDDGAVLATWNQDGLGHLGLLGQGAGAFSDLETSFTSLRQLRLAGDGTSVVAVAGSATVPWSVVRIHPRSRDGALEVLRSSRPRLVDAAYLSVAEPLDFPTEGGEVAHALYYAPTNGDFVAPNGELPPLIVAVHGGPTSAAAPVLDFEVQFWTSRGFAVVDVNYGGSSGYGRAYRERLRRNWGVVDLADCVNAARHLASTRLADVERLLVHGGSAGGYTTLCAATFTDDFAAGASYYGIADACVFAGETHKFEARYTDGLFGPWPGTADVYRQRSPVFHTESLRTPLIVFQGLEDKVVPPDQAELMVSALAEKGVPYAYVTYEGEQHGFRKAENVRRTTEAELYFYSRVLGFTPADDLEPVEIVGGDRIG